jgi:hypothetical protein
MKVYILLFVIIFLISQRKRIIDLSTDENCLFTSTSYPVNNSPRKTRKQVIDVPSDGNCLFASISYHVNDSPEETRKRIIGEMLNNRKEYEPFFTKSSENRHITTDSLDTMDLSYNHYLERMTRSGEWGGNMELSSASKVYKRPIVVYGPDSTTVIQKFGDAKYNNTPIEIRYDGRSHYNIINKI